MEKGLQFSFPLSRSDSGNGFMLKLLWSAICGG
jgi:hypothetical protein